MSEVTRWEVTLQTELGTIKHVIREWFEAKAQERALKAHPGAKIIATRALRSKSGATS